MEEVVKPRKPNTKRNSESDIKLFREQGQGAPLAGKKNDKRRNTLDAPSLDLRSRASSYCMELDCLPQEQLVGINDSNQEYYEKKFKNLIKGTEIGKGESSVITSYR